MKSVLTQVLIIVLTCCGISNSSENNQFGNYLTFSGGLFVPQDQEVKDVFDNFPKFGFGISNYYKDGAIDASISYMKKSINKEGYADGEWQILHFKADGRGVFEADNIDLYLGAGGVLIHVKETNLEQQSIGSPDAVRKRTKLAFLLLAGFDFNIGNSKTTKLFFEGSYTSATVKDTDDNEVGIGGIMVEVGLRVKL